MNNAFVQPVPEVKSNVALAKVTGTASGGVLLQFDGDAEARQGTYKVLQSYTPSVGDSVICIKISGTYIVLGKIIRG